MTCACVACLVDGLYHAANGKKSRTMLGLAVKPTTSPVTIDLEKGVKGTSVPTADIGCVGPPCGKIEFKSGTCVLVIRETEP